MQNGEISFFDDIYGHDAALAQLLDRGYPYSGWKAPRARVAK
ncbi:MAG TPA: hypothetical protein VGV35_17480 [Bryobacteraceae bacterium]|nr:hypothetical protein [Bryobacteraceae bacterium]